jgi:hypothetical protein
MLVDGQEFQQVAIEHSHDRLSQRDGGFVGWTTRGVYLHPFDSVAFSLEVGQFSKPYRDKDGWHIVYVADYLPEGLPPLERTEFYNWVLEGLVMELSGEIMREIVDSLAQDMDLVINEDVLHLNVYTAEDSIWVGIVNETDTIDFRLLRTIEMSYRRRYGDRAGTIPVKREMIKELARRLLVVQAALEDGIDTLPAVKAELYRMKHETTKSIVLRERFDTDWLPTDSAIEQYYQEHIDDYVPRKPLTVQQLLVQDSLVAEFLRGQAMAGIEFSVLERKYSAEEPGFRVKFRDLGEIGADDVDSVIYNAARETPEGDVSPPIKTEDGYCLLKVLNRIQSFGLVQVRGKIVSILKDQYEREVIGEYTQRLYDRYHVTFPEEVPRVHLKPLRFRTEETP